MNRSMPRLGLVLTFAVSCFTYLCAVPGASAAPSVTAPHTPPPTLRLPERALIEGALSEGGGNQVVVRDLASGETEARPMSVTEVDSATPPSMLVPGAAPVDRLSAVADGIVPLTFGALTLVDNTEDWPWSAHAKLIVTWPSGGTRSCSGTLIDPAFVITAAHCVYTFTSTNCTGGDTSCWASSVSVIPGYDDGVEPFGSAPSAQLYTWSEWALNHNYDWDMAGVSLSRPVGALSGWYGTGYDTDSFFSTTTFRNAGYPGGLLYDGTDLYYWQGLFDLVYAGRVCHLNQGHPGQSGSGTYHNASGVNYIYAVLSHGEGGGTYTCHTRMTDAKFTALHGWISAHTPSSVDLVALDTNVTGGEPWGLDRGDPLTSMDYLIHNWSSAAYNGTVQVDGYLSTNDIISASDRWLLGGPMAISLTPRSSVRVTVASTPSIPADLCGAWPNGTDYWIGVKVTLTDADPTNNDSSGWDAAQIHLSACDTYESDDTWQQATVLEPIDYQYHDIIPASDEDWVTFTLTETSGIYLVTGPADDFDDTRMWLYDEGLQLIEENNDSSYDAFAQIVRRCSTDPLPAGTYYARVTENGGDAKIRDYQLNFESEPCGSQSVFLPLVVRAQGTVAFSAR